MGTLTDGETERIFSQATGRAIDSGANDPMAHGRRALVRAGEIAALEAARALIIDSDNWNDAYHKMCARLAELKKEESNG